jgi:hypothetical protein
VARAPLQRPGSGAEGRLELELQELERKQRLARIMLELLDDPDPEARHSLLRASADGHCDDRRRGLPMIGSGVSGARHDQDPVRALLAKEGGRPRRS